MTQTKGGGFTQGRPSELHPLSIARSLSLPLHRFKGRAYSWDDLLAEAVDAYWSRRPVSREVTTVAVA